MGNYDFGIFAGLVCFLSGALLASLMSVSLTEKATKTEVMNNCLSTNTFIYTQDIKFSCTLLPKQ